MHVQMMPQVFHDDTLNILNNRIALFFNHLRKVEKAFDKHHEFVILKNLIFK